MFFKIFNPGKHSALVIHQRIRDFHNTTKEVSDCGHLRQVIDDSGYKIYRVINDTTNCCVAMYLGAELKFFVYYADKAYEVEFDTAIVALSDLNSAALFIRHLPKRDRKKAEKRLTNLRESAWASADTSN